MNNNTVTAIILHSRIEFLIISNCTSKTITYESINCYSNVNYLVSLKTFNISTVVIRIHCI